MPGRSSTTSRARRCTSESLSERCALSSSDTVGDVKGAARIGCSGWSYRDWRGSVYPRELPRRRWFEFYAAQFDTVEINATFYRLPAIETVENWARQAPEGFTYSVKLGQFGSHRMKLRDAARWLPNHVERVERLGACLGPTLVQLPPGGRRDAARLDDFLAVAPKRMRWAVEFRDPSWLHEEVFDVLGTHGAALVLHDLLPDHPWLVTTDWTYLRFHGPRAVDDPYRGRYTGRRLWRAADRAEQWRAGGIDVYAYFNNDYGGSAVTDAKWFRQRLEAVPYRPQP